MIGGSLLYGRGIRTSIVPSSGEGNEQAGCLPHSVGRRRLHGREHSRNKFEIGGANVPQLIVSSASPVQQLCMRYAYGSQMYRQMHPESDGS